ncbi:acyl-CoA dehydrogenase family protein [Sphingomonas crocodyli]|uniref:Acyl-CoA dehydrogenase n=1 Tax=Sphingomonas crocodyli TaxID=1979270 RepID=A0A437M6F4_9SPHN|nr:acyl-CoA dehydrogenase family protein [Sphingomonas crocodyli]RVT93252.1 acyl-CoA dehydrogenase [Sphingomonas crocodyli]
MDFRLTEDQTVLVEGVRDWLTGVHGPDTLRALDETPSRRSAEIAQGLVEMGLPGLLASDEAGGLGLTTVEAVLIAIEAGKAGLAEPMIDSAFVALPILAAAGKTDLVAAIASGEAKVALQHPINPWVADLEGATHLLSAEGGKLSIGAAVAGEALDSVDPLRRLSAPVAASGEAIDARADALLDRAALFAAAQALGAADAMLAQAVEYANTRQQFGQSIGTFQAIKHHCASISVAIEFARPVVLRAAYAVEHGEPNAAIHVSHAKLAACDAAYAAGETAIQVHGAMGYTYEVNLHFWMKRAWALAGGWGDRAFHLDRVEKAITGTMPIGPAATFA